MSVPPVHYPNNPSLYPLWTDNPPNSKTSPQSEYRERKDEIELIKCVQCPTIELRLPAKRSGNTPAVLIFPGGGYECLAYEWEGTETASLLNAHGIAAVIVKYRLPDPESNFESHRVPLLDAERAIRTVRHNAESWGLDRNRIGVVGFSAGGHLASTLGTNFSTGNAKAPDPIDRWHSRPDFMALIYAVTNMSPEVKVSCSRDKLLGPDPDLAMMRRYTTQLQVSSDTPPTFLLHSSDDHAVAIADSVQFYRTLLANGVPAEMHLYPYGGHGFSLAHGQGRLANWAKLFVDWIQSF